ncbi:MAG: DUF5721 family protein [Lachnospiraceae bacterium]|nr:DUF5721 family protein [Robinsoniella sp.]MDY3766521.1 DUF5721 family protein [Lachnospiraceae bacterium]
MVHLKILEIKPFMSKLLLQDVFDCFLLLEASISTGNIFTIDGHRNRDFYTKEEYEELTASEYALTPWYQLRHYCYDIIKGSRTPSQFKLIFQLSLPDLEQLIQKAQVPFTVHDVNGLFLNIKYDGSSLSCITGISLRLFSLDKSLEHAWDQKIQLWFEHAGIVFDLL